MTEPDSTFTGHIFRDPSLLRTALTHSSFSNETREHPECNERLEFLGDSVLNFLAAEYLFASYPDLPEGELTKLRASAVCEGSLHRFAVSVGLGEHLLLGHGEENNGGRARASVLADAAEAVIAALYLDGGIGAAADFIMPHLRRTVSADVRATTVHDCKTALQEIVQKNRQETLHYELTNTSGPDHEKTFTVTLYINSNPVAVGLGSSKKDAEQSAAREALRLMGEDV